MGSTLGYRDRRQHKLLEFGPFLWLVLSVPVGFAAGMYSGSALAHGVIRGMYTPMDRLVDILHGAALSSALPVLMTAVALTMSIRSARRQGHGGVGLVICIQTVCGLVSCALASGAFLSQFSIVYE